MNEKFLPVNNSDYSKSDYWESRYSQEREEDYEWLGNYEAFRSVLLPGLDPSKHSVLILGCGNSTLGPDMVIMDGFKNVTSVDIASSVIQKQIEKYEDNPCLKWRVMDITDLSYFEDESFDIVIEKATLDAFIASEKSPWSLSESTLNLIHGTCKETSRVLRKGGLFLSLTFSQPHFRIPLYAKEEYDWGLHYSKIQGDNSSLDYYFYRMVKGETLDADDDSSSSISTYSKNGIMGLSNLKITESDIIPSSSDEEEGFVGKFNFELDL